MHEYSIVQALIGRVEQEVASIPGAIARRLRIRVGELSGVEVDLLQTAYETFREATVCAEAELLIARVGVCWGCPSCAGEIPAGGTLRCPTCGVAAQLLAGDEMHLDRIEMEVPDV